MRGVSLIAVELTPRAVVGRFRGKTLRYGTVSVISTTFSQLLLFTTHARLGWAAWAANVFAVSISAVPSYLLNRAWVWSKRGRNHLTREVLPFWTMALVGLALSTVLVAAASGAIDARWVPNVANLAAFGLLWAGKFLLLDAVLFAPHRPVAASRTGS